jgi:hypothetical protein
VRGSPQMGKRCVWCGEDGYTHHGGERQTPLKWIWQELQKTMASRVTIRHREPHDFLCEQICSALPKRPQPAASTMLKETMIQFWPEPRRSCRLSNQEKCLRQGRRSSEGGSKPTSPLRPDRRALRRRKCRANARAHATGSGLSTGCSRPVCWTPRLMRCLGPPTLLCQLVKYVSESRHALAQLVEIYFRNDQDIHCGARTNRGVTGPIG